MHTRRHKAMLFETGVDGGLRKVQGRGGILSDTPHPPPTPSTLLGYHLLAEHLFSICKALASAPSTKKKEKENCWPCWWYTP